MNIIIHNNRTVDFEDCVIQSRNFAGMERTNGNRVVNSAGRRNFLLILDQEAHDILKAEGYDVGMFRPKDDESDPEGYARVTVSWYKRPPIIHSISEGVDTILDEDHVYQLDRVDISQLDMRCSGVKKQNQKGEWVTKLYVDELWATVVPDRFSAKYSNLKSMRFFGDDGAES